MTLSKCITFAFGALLMLQLYTSLVRSECVIRLHEDYHSKSPLFVDRKFNFMYPKHNESDILRFNWFQDRLVYCPGNHVVLNGVRYPMRHAKPYHQPPVIRCIKERIFQLEDGTHQQFNLNQMSCFDTLDIVDWYTGTLCGDGEVYNLGFALYQDLGKATIKLCHIEELATTTWAHAVIPRAIMSKPSTIKSKTFQKGILFQDISMNRYNICQQIETLKEIFYDDVYYQHSDDETDDNPLSELEQIEKEAELTKLVAKYIRNNGTENNYFVEGHLISEDYKFYAPEQQTTYFYSNAVPMWDSIKNGNWKYIKDQVLKLTRQNGDLEIIVGGIGVLQLEDKDIYLARRKNQEQPAVLPAPKILYKLVYSSEQNQAIAFLIANNPYLKDEQIKEYTICKQYQNCPVSMFSNRNKGYAYCCLFHDFMASPHVSHLSLPVELSGNVAPFI